MTTAGTPLPLSLITAQTGPWVVDLAGRAGVHRVILDAEGTGVHAGDCRSAVDALRAARTVISVRLPDGAPSAIREFGELRPNELLLPAIRSADEVDAAWDVLQEVDCGNDQRPALSVIVETWDAVNDLGRIIASPRVGDISVGLNDLRSDLESRGVGGELDDVVELLLQSLRRSGRPFTLPVRDREAVRRAREVGASGVAVYLESYVLESLKNLSAEE